MKQKLPDWYFGQGMERNAAAEDMYNALGDGHKAAYLNALARFQAASGGLKTCPGALQHCPWNPPDTDPSAAVIGWDAEGFMTMGGVRLPLA